MTGRQQLAEYKARIEKGERIKIPVRTLFWHFDYLRRGKNQVDHVLRELARLSMRTEPDFQGLYIDLPVELKVDAPKPPPSAEAGTNAEANEAKADVVPSDPTFRLGQLEAANLATKGQSMATTTPTSPLAEAVTTMLAHDFSQLPVMNGKTLKGIVSWKSIGQRLALGRECVEVRHAMDGADVLAADTALFDAIPTIIRKDYVLVRQPDNSLSGIVTTSDLSDEFRRQTEPFLVLGEIENHLRDLINARFAPADLAGAKYEGDDARKIESAADLTFGEYLRLLENEANWTKLDLRLDRKTFVAHIDDVREIRNDVMHFDPDPLGESEITQLRAFVAFLQRLREMGMF